MTTQRRTLDEIVQALHGKLALDNDRRVRFHDEVHVVVRLRPLELCLRERAHTRENQVIAHRLYLDTVRQRIEVAHDFLEVGRGQIDDGRVFHVGNHQLLGVGLD